MGCHKLAQQAHRYPLSQKFTSPSDNQFKEYFKSILGDDSIQFNEEEYHSDVYIPILDNPITPLEVSKISLS